MKKVGIDPDVEYLRHRRRHRIHHMHLFGYAAFATLTLIGMLIFLR